MNARVFLAVPVVCAAFVSIAACGDSDSSSSPSSSSSGGSSSSGTSSSSSSTSSSSSSSGSSGTSSGSSGTSSGSSGTDGGSDAGDGGGDAGPPTMTFFVTSKGNGKGGDFRANAGDADGLAGADAFCKSLAQAVSPALGAKNWKAYLSTANVTARSRIGNGPWYNAKGQMIATSVASLHDEGGKNMLMTQTSVLDETGKEVPTNPTTHDTLTGANANGSSSANTCNNWTSSNTNVKANVGHSNRAGGGADPTSWNAAHQSGGCADGRGQGGVGSGGGRGSIYCFVP